jgi:hypothetical protein
MVQALLVVHGVLNSQRQKMNEKLLDLVVQLHDIARTIENDIGIGQLSEDIRNAADRLNVLLKPMENV